MVWEAARLSISLIRSAEGWWVQRGRAAFRVEAELPSTAELLAVIEKLGDLLPTPLRWRMFFSRQERNPAYLRSGDVVTASIATEDGTLDLGTQRLVVRVALGMVRELPKAGLPPAHVGVAAGPVVVQGGDYFGRTVNLAARIAGRAAAGQVLVSERVAQTVSSQDVIFVEHGELRLKGIAAPVRVLEARRL